MNPKFFRQYLDILNEGPPPGIGPNAPLKAKTPPPLNVPQGWEAKTQPDGSTRISKIGSMSSAEYKQNMADYKAQNWTPEKMADYGQRMASGQGYTDAERAANYQQQQKSFGQYADDTGTPQLAAPAQSAQPPKQPSVQEDSDNELQKLKEFLIKRY